MTMVLSAMPEIVELLEQVADHLVVLHHAVGVEADAGDAPPPICLRCVQTCMRVVLNQTKNGLLVLVRRSMNFGRRGEDLLDRRSASRSGERAGVFDRLPALAVTPRMQHAARPELLPELGILRIVVGLGLLLGIEVVEIAEELVEPVHGRQVLVAVAEVVLAELAGGVALRLEQVGNRRRPVGDALRRTRHADGEQPRAERVLTEDEGGAAGGATLLGVEVGEQRAFLREAIDVGRLVAHHAEVVGADVVDADVVAPDDEDVRLLAGLLRLCGPANINTTAARTEPMVAHVPAPQRLAACCVMPFLQSCQRCPDCLLSVVMTGVRSTLTSLARTRRSASSRSSC